MKCDPVGLMSCLRGRGNVGEDHHVFPRSAWYSPRYITDDIACTFPPFSFTVDLRNEIKKLRDLVGEVRQASRLL